MNLAPRALFFKGSPALILMPQFFEGHGWLWWIGFILIAWAVYCIVFGWLWYKWGARFFFGERPPDDDD